MAETDLVSISASIAHRGPTTVEVEDTAEGVLTFSDGLQGLFYLTVNYSTDAPTLLELDCEKGVARLDGAHGWFRTSDGVEAEADEDGSEAASFGGGKDYWGFSHYRQIREFYHDPDGRRAAYTCEEALKTQAMLCGIYASAKSGRCIKL